MDAIQARLHSAQETIHLMQEPIPDLRRRVDGAATSRFRSGINYLQDRYNRGILGSLIHTGTRTSLVESSQLESIEMIELVDTFSLLHKLIKKEQPHNKKQIIEHVQTTIETLESVIGKNPPRSIEEKNGILGKIEEIFASSLPNGQDIEANFQEMSRLRSFLYRYLYYLDGREPCTRVQLKSMRQLLANRLFNPAEEGPRGFLQNILHIQSEQQGNLAFSAISHNLVEAISRAAMRKFAVLTGINPNKSPFSEFEDPDIPGSEIIIHPNGQREILSHSPLNKNPLSVMNLLSGAYEYFKNGTSPTLLTWYVETLKVALTHIQIHVRNLRTQGTDQDLMQSNERTDHSLQSALYILTSLQRSNISKEDVERGLHEIAELLKSHPIGIKYLFHINPFSFLPSLSEVGAHPVDTKDPVDVLQDLIHNLEGEAKIHQARLSVDENTAFSWEIETVRKTSIRFVIYQAISWWIGPLPSSLSIPTFDLMMTKLYKSDGTPLVTPDQAEIIFRESMGEMIEKCTHMFFITRWLTELALPVIEWVCTYALSRVFKEVNARITHHINTSYNEATGDARTSIPDTLASVANAIVNAYKLYNEGQNSSGINNTEIISHHFFHDPRKLFLRGHEGIDSIYHCLEVALLNLLRDFSWTEWMSGWNDNLIQWSSDTNYTIVQAVCWTIVAPLRALLWTLNTLVVWPIQTTFNYIMKWGASKLLSIVELPKLLTEKAIHSVIGNTEFTPVLDEILLDLLKMLWELKQEPIDPNSQFDEIKTSQKTVDSIANMLSSLLKVLFISKNQLGVFAPILQGLSTTLEGSALDSVSRLLAKSSVVLARNQKKLCTLALSTIHRAMITGDAPSRSIEGKNSRALIDHYIRILGWEAVRTAPKLSGLIGDEELRINTHARELQKQFGFQSTFAQPSEKIPIKKEDLVPVDPVLRNIGFHYQSKLVEWMNTVYHLFEGHPQNPIVINALGNLDKIHKELLQISHALRSELILIESDASVSKAGLELHKEKVLAISQALSEFQKGFQVIHEFYLNKAHPGLSNIHRLLSHISFRTGAIQASLGFIQMQQNGMQNGELELQNLRFQLGALKQAHAEFIGNIPPQGPLSEIAQLLDMSLRTLETNLCFISEKRKNFIDFIKKRIQPIATTSGTLSDFTSRVLEFTSHDDSRGLFTFLHTHLAEIQAFLPYWNTPGTNDNANFSLLQRILDLPRDLPLLTNATTKKHLVIQRCNEFKDTLTHLGTSLQNEVNGECTRAERNFSTLTQRTTVQFETTGSILQISQIAYQSQAVRDAIGQYPTNAEGTNGSGMFGSILKLERAIASLTSVDRTSFDLLQTIPIAPFVQKKIFDFIYSTVYSLLRTVIQDKSVLEGFVMRLYVHFLENQGINLSHKAQTTDYTPSRG